MTNHYTDSNSVGSLLSTFHFQFSTIHYPLSTPLWKIPPPPSHWQTYIMATIETKQPRQKAGVKRLIKKATRVDLTPMVDLGFLLITFFVFTTSMTKPKVLRVNEPFDKQIDINNEVCASCALTLVPGNNNTIYYYEGIASSATAVKTTTYSPDGLRSLILRKKNSVAALNDPSKKLTLIIKPGNDSNMQNFVDLLDEVLINMVPMYYVAEPDADDKRLMPDVWQ
jgi:Biopolymer transport protein ExbD/TolR